MKARQRGFSRLELGVAAMVAAVLAGGLLLALARYQGRVERHAVELVVHQIHTGLRLRLMDGMLNNRRDDLARLAGTNPLALRGELTENYLGELSQPPVAGDCGWFFDAEKRELAYRPCSRHFPHQPGEEAELRWKLMAVKERERPVAFVQISASFP